MNKFCEVKLFQVKPDKTAEFEALAAQMQAEQAQQTMAHLKTYSLVQ